MTRIHRFGEFRLDPATRELRRGGAPVALPPRAFDCIVYLLEHRDRAVGRDELIAAVWGRADIGDGMLGQTVLSARRALDDTGKDQHCIRTVFRFGYHWVAATVEDDRGVDLPVTPPPAGAGAAPGRARARRRWLAPAALLSAGLALGAAAVWHRAKSPDRPAASRTGLVLVMPVSVTAGAGFDWVRLGLMDLVAARLRTVGLAVVPSDNVVALSAPRDAGTPLQPAALAAATGASLIVETQAELSGGHWQVTLRTVRGRQPPLLASGRSDDVLAAARQASDELARQLGYRQAQPDGGPEAADALAPVLQQVDAAILTDRLDAARALLESTGTAGRRQPQAQLRLAQIDYQSGRFAAAESGYAAIAAAVSAEQDPVLHARALTGLGVLAAQRDSRALAMRRFDEAIALLRRESAPDALGKALNGHAAVAMLSGQREQALQDIAEARLAFENAGDLLALAVLDSNLGAIDMQREHYADAEPAFARAAQRFATFGVNAAELNARTAIAELELALLRPHDALAQEPRLRELVAAVADPARRRNGELTRIEILAANGRVQAATSALADVRGAAERSADRSARARAQAITARLALDAGDVATAATAAATALTLFTDADDARERARCWRLRSRALLDASDRTQAAAAVAGLEAFAAHDASPAARFYAGLARADLAAAAGDAGAGTLYQHALAAADAGGIPLDTREAARAYVRWLLQAGELARAGAVAERLTGWAERDFPSALLQLRVQHALGHPGPWRSSLARARALAGERAIPSGLLAPPAPDAAAASTP